VLSLTATFSTRSSELRLSQAPNWNPRPLSQATFYTEVFIGLGLIATQLAPRLIKGFKILALSEQRVSSTFVPYRTVFTKSPGYTFSCVGEEKFQADIRRIRNRERPAVLVYDFEVLGCSIIVPVFYTRRSGKVMGLLRY